MPIYSDELVQSRNSSDSIQQEILNVYNNVDYVKSANAVKLLPIISNNQGKMKIYTELNSNIKVGDKIFFMYNDITPSNSRDLILDNYLEFSGCTDWELLIQMQGYKVLEINDSNNEITINRYYDKRYNNRFIYDHYISKIYTRNLILSEGELDGVLCRQIGLNNSGNTTLYIKLTQIINFSGNSYSVLCNNKYDSEYISLNSILSTGSTQKSTYKPYQYRSEVISNFDQTPSTSYYTYNNNNYGYNYIYNNSFEYGIIDNGNFENCTFKYLEINNGIFKNCTFSGCTINNGEFTNCTVDIDSCWFYGQWNGGNIDLRKNDWINGIWNSGDFPSGKKLNGDTIRWKNGTFNSGNFTESNWMDGTFQGGKMSNCTWSNGKFNGGEIVLCTWENGIFNGGLMRNCYWKNGTCNGGSILNTTWITGTFNNGDFTSSTWFNGTFNNGSFYNSYWENGNFYNGVFNSINSCESIINGELIYSNLNRYWNNGNFYNGTFQNSVWKNGTFYNGTFQTNSLWSGGTFKNGSFNNSYWLYGNFENGNVLDSYFHNVNWTSGTWTGGQLGTPLNLGSSNQEQPTIHWSGGTFNSGIFGNGYMISDPYGGVSYNTNVNWYNGTFYNGTFYSYYTGCTSYYGVGGFYNGIIYYCNFYGTLWGGAWQNGVFGGCNKTEIITPTDPPSIILPIGIGGKQYGEGPIEWIQNSSFLD